MSGLKPSFSWFSFTRVTRLCALPFLLLWIGLGVPGSCVQAANAPLIVVTQKPLTLLVSELVGEAAVLMQVIPDGASPHEFSLSWSGRRQLAEADLVVWGGAALEPQLAGVIATLPADRVLDASAAVVSWPVVADCHSHAHEAGSGEPAHRGTGPLHHHDDEPEQCRDPHFWLNPNNMLAVVDMLLERLPPLAAMDAKRLNNAGAELKRRIEALDLQARQVLAPLADRFYVVEHDAYNHFSQHYGLRQPGFLRAGHGMPIGPRSLAALRARTDIGCVYTEPEYSPELARRLAEYTGSPLQALDPLGSQVELALGYSGFMARFVTAFSGCLAPVD